MWNPRLMLSTISHVAFDDAGSFYCALCSPCDPLSAAEVQVVRAACNNLQSQSALLLSELLIKFSSLKLVDVSCNPGLRLLPVCLLQVAASLESFNCCDCSLVLPPQIFFSSAPDQNPMRIRRLLQSGSSEIELQLSSSDLTAADVSEVSRLLQHYPILKRLDVSSNPGLGCSGVASVLSVLSGMLCSGALSHFKL
jgi:hypothetical protein